MTTVTLADNLPAGVQFVGATSGHGTCAPPPLNGTFTVTCTLKLVSAFPLPGGTATATIFVRPTAAGTLTNQVVVAPQGGGDSVPANNVSTATTTVTATSAVTLRSFSAAGGTAGVTVRWRTASELDTLGFNVYREVNGKRVRANTRMIAAKGRGSYSFLDRKAPKAKSVRYWVQEVTADGSRSWYGPARVTKRA